MGNKEGHANRKLARWWLSTSGVAGKIYVIGGTTSGGGSLSTVEVYDPATDTWTKKADMPTARFAPATSAVNGFIYVIGGTPGIPEELPIRNAISIVDAYDTGVGIRVTTISSQEGRIAGGEPISIFGSRFPPDAVVTIGGKPLTDLQVKSDTLITGVIPPGTVGEYNVLIEAPSIDFRVFAAKFIYTAPSAVLVTGLNPTNGAQAGGETGNITAVGFKKAQPCGSEKTRRRLWR